MDEKMKKALDELFEKLTDEQKAKAKECKTFDELMDFAGKEGIELPDDMLDNVAGGFTIDWKPVELTYDVPSTKTKKKKDDYFLDAPPPPTDLY